METNNTATEKGNEMAQQTVKIGTTTYTVTERGPSPVEGCDEVVFMEGPRGGQVVMTVWANGMARAWRAFGSMADVYQGPAPEIN